MSEHRSRADEARALGLRLAVDLYARRPWGDDRHRDGDSAELGQVIDAARDFAWILYGRADRLTLNDPVITEQATGRPVPLNRGDNMPVTITDAEIADYSGSVSETDSKGFPVSDALTWSEDSNGAVVSGDGAGVFTAVAPGTANITVTDGTLSATDSIEVDPGAAASLLLGAPVITEQAAPVPPAV